MQLLSEPTSPSQYSAEPTSGTSTTVHAQCLPSHDLAARRPFSSLKNT
eukprot:CAMPEP_0202107630 /NCGR_PEP_ID=MMETSP0965-20130614/17266_1 /ASSEMBLY_ACC=CAM_ASM_000507 /TAXON_ID=4773 /ORGANISM="Schizochytrium aggregatum, Strain ATCC28209" /LENGTH=47 /DNA_ID= /DNA_START= /DNA_END= /DNA_ORIENTATION=